MTNTKRVNDVTYNLITAIDLNCAQQVEPPYGAMYVMAKKYICGEAKMAEQIQTTMTIARMRSFWFPLNPKRGWQIAR